MNAFLREAIWLLVVFSGDIIIFILDFERISRKKRVYG